jgi:hypothetical protein
MLDVMSFSSLSLLFKAHKNALFFFIPTPEPLGKVTNSSVSSRKIKTNLLVFSCMNSSIHTCVGTCEI